MCACLRLCEKWLNIASVFPQKRRALTWQILKPGKILITHHFTLIGFNFGQNKMSYSFYYTIHNLRVICQVTRICVNDQAIGLSRDKQTRYCIAQTLLHPSHLVTDRPANI